MMDIAYVLDRLVYAAQYSGSLTGNTREQYENLEWHDERPKPTWEELEAAWPEAEVQVNASLAEAEKERKLLTDQRLITVIEILAREIIAIRKGQPVTDDFIRLVQKLQELGV